MSETKPRSSASATNSAMYQLKLSLSGTPAWRRLLVREDMNIGLLHAVIQVAMGWTNSHLHLFFINNKLYTDPSTSDNMDIDGPPELDEGKSTLKEVAPREKTKFTYEYDFGDSWEHKVTVEKIHAPDGKRKHFAECIDGRGGCPPEDCGGVGGYAELLDIMKEPGHSEYESMKEWLGDRFDPEKLDIDHVNAHLRMLKWPRTSELGLAKVLMARDGFIE